MASMFTNYLIRWLRDRKKFSQDYFLKELEIARENVSNIERNQQTPNLGTLNKLLDTMGASTSFFHYPLLENQTQELLQIRASLLYNIRYAAEDPAAMQKAQEIIKALKDTGGFEETINQQFINSCEIALHIIQGHCPIATMALIDEAIALTFPEFDENNFEGDMLLFDEMSLLHSKAQVHKVSGNLQAAIRLLTYTLQGIERLPTDERDKEQKQATITLTLVECYMLDGNYAMALKVCRDGCKLSKKRNKGFHLPDFAAHMATCLTQIGEKAEAANWARQAYFGYIMQRRNKKAINFLQHARNALGIEVKTYGADTLELRLPEPRFEYGSAFYYNKKHKDMQTSDLSSLVGQIIAVFREDAGLKQSQLCTGICTVDRLSKVENGRRPGNVFELEVIMQRLGRDIDKYFNTLPKHEDFMSKQKRDTASGLIANRKYDEAESLILELEADEKFMRYSVNRQFVASNKATLFKQRNKSHEAEYFTMLQQAMQMTRPKFDLRDVATTRHSYYEVVLLNKMAISLCTAEETKRKGMHLYEDIIDSMDEFYVDSSAKSRMYSLILRNYALKLVGDKRWGGVMDYVKKGEEIALLYTNNYSLPGFAACKASYLLNCESADKEKSLAYTAITYYGSMLINRPKNAKEAIDYARDNFDVDFD